MKIKTIVLAGLLVGSLDILAACVDYYIATGNGPSGVLRYIASGVFGSKAFTGGGSMIVWGLVFHFIITFAFTFLFFWLYTNIKIVSRYPVISAVAYGIFMWAITTLLIVPLSNTPSIAFNFWKAVKAVLILICMICIPLIFISRMSVRRRIAD